MGRFVRVYSAIVALFAIGLIVPSPTRAQGVLDEWNRVVAPPPPEIHDVQIDPTTTGAASLNFLTFIGGSLVFTGGTGPCQNFATDLKVDASGGAGQVEAVVLGLTNCRDFPVTFGGPTTGTDDLFLTRLTPSGAAIDNSTLLGGNGSQHPRPHRTQPGHQQHRGRFADGPGDTEDHRGGETRSSGRHQEHRRPYRASHRSRCCLR